MNLSQFFDYVTPRIYPDGVRIRNTFPTMAAFLKYLGHVDKIRDLHDHSLLYHAAQQGSVEALLFLEEQGLSDYGLLQHSYNSMPLIAAFMIGQLHFVDALLDRPAVWSKRRVIIERASSMYIPELVRYLVRRGCEVDDLVMDSIVGDHTVRFETLIKIHVEEGIPISRLSECIHTAQIMGRSPKIIRILKILEKWDCTPDTCVEFTSCVCSADPNTRDELLNMRHMYHFGRSFVSRLI